MEKNELGPGGRRVLLEETLEGEELSFIILTDGKRYAPLIPTRDHKRVFDGNQGPNTGGMGPTRQMNCCRRSFERPSA